METTQQKYVAFLGTETKFVFHKIMSADDGIGAPEKVYHWEDSKVDLQGLRGQFLTTTPNSMTSGE